MLTRDDISKMSAIEALNVAFDDIPELGFKLAPKGTYKTNISKVEAVKRGEDDVIVVAHTIGEVIELVNVEETPPEVGTEIQMSYFLPTGIVNLKKDYGSCASTLGCASLPSFLEEFVGKDTVTTFGHYVKKDKETPDGSNDKVYQTIASCELFS